jgi:hypothetical protein
VQLTSDHIALLPSEADIAFYREHGWYISKKILSDELIDEALGGSMRHFAGERDHPLPYSSGFSDWKPEHADTIRNCEYVALQNDQIRRLVQEPIIGAIAARLCGSGEVRLFDDQLIYKPPACQDTASVVGWHTDRAYWMTCTSDQMLTAWVPFHDCSETMGPLMVIDKSHKWTHLSNGRTFNCKDLGDLEREYRRTEGEFPKILIVLKKGQVSFHNCLTIHGSDVNRGPSPRISFAIHMQDGSNRYRVYENEQGIPWRLFNDRLCRVDGDGSPDYTDPAVFPLLWSEHQAMPISTDKPRL